MADVGGTVRGMGERSSTSSAATRLKIVPNSGWTEDSNGHYLLVDLPDFKKEEVKLEVNISAGHITVSGHRQLNERKSVYFENNFTIPPSSDVDKITGKFDGEILYVTVPKATARVEEKKEPELKNQNVEAAAAEPAEVENKTVDSTAAENIRPRPENGGECSKKYGGTKYGELKKLAGNGSILFSLEDIRKWENETGILRTAMEILSKNKRIVTTAVVAFSLGMLVSHKFQSAGE